MQAWPINTDYLRTTKGEGLEDVTHTVHTTVNEDDEVVVREVAAHAERGDDLNNDPKPGACHIELAAAVMVQEHNALHTSSL